MMAKPSGLLETLGAEWFDATKIKTYQMCPRKYYYRHELKLVPKGEMAPALAFGIAIHAGLESIYKGHGLEKVPCILHETRPLSDCRYCDGSGDTRRFLAEFLKHMPAEAESGARTRDIGCELLLRYLQQWRDDRMTSTILAVEQPFAFQLDGIDAYWVGRLDLIIADSPEKIVPWDHKTASRFGEAFEGGFKIDVQITGYMVAISKIYHHPCSEAIINALRVTTKISNESFLRKLTTRQPHEIDEWYTTIGKAIMQIRESRETGKWEQRDSGCFAYNHPCEYRGLCLMAPANRQALIDAAYTVEEWEPV